MKHRSAETFKRAVRFAGLDYSDKQIEDALVKCSIEELQRQERAKGFKERSVASKTFFRKGEAGAWRYDLTETQVKQLIRDHKDVMQAFGYMDGI